jgi:hypothetical protein
MSNGWTLKEVSTLFKGETVLAEMRKYFKNECVTVNQIREMVTRSGSYLREVLEKSAAAGIIKKDKKCVQEATCYEIDPQDDKATCPPEPEKSYEESICFTLEKSIERSVLAKELDLSDDYSDRHQITSSGRAIFLPHRALNRRLTPIV